MENKVTGNKDIDKKAKASEKDRPRKMSEYGRQLFEKQKVKEMYGVREKQFRRFFQLAIRQDGATGENLLSLLERRLDNTVYRLKMSKTRNQSRQMIVHGHILVNGKKVYTPSYFVSEGDVVSLNPRVLDKKEFVENVIDKRMKVGIKIPEWLELDKQERVGRVLRKPVRQDVQVPIEDHLIVEFYSK